MNPTIEPMLIASTGHITLEENTETFPQEAANPTNLIVYDIEYGWLLFVGNSEKLVGLSEGATAIAELAREHKCLWVKFDQDGDLYEDLPYYDW